MCVASKAEDMRVISRDDCQCVMNASEEIGSGNGSVHFYGVM